MDNVNEVFKNILLEGFFKVKQPATIKKYVVEVEVNEDATVNADIIGQALADAGMRGKVSTAPETGYNGWTNYETWLCNLWLTNEEKDYKRFRRLAHRLDTYELAQRIRGHMEQQADKFIGKRSAGFFADIVNSALREVDYYRIAESFKES